MMRDEDDASILPIRIRENLVVQVADLPDDLTLKEANKISRVIQALAEGNLMEQVRGEI